MTNKRLLTDEQLELIRKKVETALSLRGCKVAVKTVKELIHPKTGTSFLEWEVAPISTTYWLFSKIYWNPYSLGNVRYYDGVRFEVNASITCEGAFGNRESFPVLDLAGRVLDDGTIKWHDPIGGMS